MALIAPHVRRAMLIGNVIDLSRIRNTAFAETIDGLDAGIFLVGAQGALVHANRSGRAMLDAGNPLRLAQDVVVVCDANADRELRDAFAAAADRDEAVATAGIAVPLKGRTEENFIAHVLPLTSGARREAGLNSAAVAALFVRRASIDLAAAIEAASRLYGLTPAEVRVLRTLVEVGGVTAMAEMLGTSKSTIKRHLEHVFAKTGTRRQTDLVKLFAGFESPAGPVNQK